MLVATKMIHRSCDIHLSDGAMCKTIIFQLCNRMQELAIVRSYDIYMVILMFIYCIYIRPQPYRKFFQREDEPCLIYIWFGYLPWWTVGKMKYLQHSSSFTVTPPLNQTPIRLHQSVIQMILVYQTYRKETKMVNCVRSKNSQNSLLQVRPSLCCNISIKWAFTTPKPTLLILQAFFHHENIHHHPNIHPTHHPHHPHTHTHHPRHHPNIHPTTYPEAPCKEYLPTFTLEMLPLFT